MGIRQSLAVGALSSLAMVVAHAQVVEVTVDVTPTSRTIGSVVDGAVVQQRDDSFQPQAFTYTVSFDLSDSFNSGLMPIDGYPTSAPYDKGMWATGAFSVVAESATPYTATLMAMAPDAQPLGFPVQGSYTLAAADPAAAGTSQALYQDARFAKVSLWLLSGGMASYGRSLDFATMGAPVAAQDLKDWTPAEYTAYLQGLTGQVFEGAFHESYLFDTLTASPTSQLPPVLVGTPEAPVPTEPQYHSVAYLGDITIRAVTMVPEPATHALMGLGLMAVGGVMGRRRV